jgi:hypothetical protein
VGGITGSAGCSTFSTGAEEGSFAKIVPDAARSATASGTKAAWRKRERTLAIHDRAVSGTPDFGMHCVLPIFVDFTIAMGFILAPGAMLAFGLLGKLWRTSHQNRANNVLARYGGSRHKYSV